MFRDDPERPGRRERLSPRSNWVDENTGDIDPRYIGQLFTRTLEDDVKAARGPDRADDGPLGPNWDLDVDTFHPWDGTPCNKRDSLFVKGSREKELLYQSEMYTDNTRYHGGRANPRRVDRNNYFHGDIDDHPQHETQMNWREKEILGYNDWRFRGKPIEETRLDYGPMDTPQ